MTTNAVATRDTQMQAVDAIRARSDQFLDLLGGDERARDRWLTVALHAVTSNPDILKCDPLTVVEAVRASASMGLELNGLMGEAYLIKYGNKAQFQVGWRGLLRLARRSGDIAAIDAQVVYSNDAFDVDLGSEPKVTHKPALSDRGNRVGVYGWARLTSGELVVEWMDNDQVELVRRSGAKGGPWVDWYDEMARKTVIKRLCKRLPLDSLAQRALEAEARADSLGREQGGTSTRSAPHRAAAPVQRVQERLGITAGRRAASVGPGADSFVTEGDEETPHPAMTSRQGDLPEAGPPAGADARPSTWDAMPSNDEAGTPTSAPSPAGTEAVVPLSPASVPHPAPDEPPPSGADMPPPPATAAASCDAFHAEYGRCRRMPGHKGNHQGATQESWR